MISDAHPLGVNSASGMRMAAPARTADAGVERLLPVADRVRDVHGRDAERADLAHGGGAGARHDEVGDRERQVHPVDVARSE